MALPSNPQKPKDVHRLTVEAAALRCIGDTLRVGVEGFDPRTRKSFTLISGALRFDVGRVFLSTETINDDGEYFEISCKLRRK